MAARPVEWSKRRRKWNWRAAWKTAQDRQPAHEPDSGSRTVNSSERANTRWQERLTLLQGLLPFDKARLGPDIMAGITLAALGIPEVMGYTKIIGTPVITGLYTLLLPVLLFALFGSSRS